MRAYTKGASTPGSSTGPGGPWIRAALSLATRRLGGRVPTRLSHLQLEASPQPDLDSPSDLTEPEQLRLTPVCGLIVIGSLCFSLSGQPFRTWPGA